MIFFYEILRIFEIILTYLFKKGVNNRLIIFHSLRRSEAFLFRFREKFDKRMFHALTAGIWKGHFLSLSSTFLLHLIIQKPLISFRKFFQQNGSYLSTIHKQPNFISFSSLIRRL